MWVLPGRALFGERDEVSSRRSMYSVAGNCSMTNAVVETFFMTFKSEADLEDSCSRQEARRLDAAASRIPCGARGSISSSPSASLNR